MVADVTSSVVEFSAGSASVEVGRGENGGEREAVFMLILSSLLKQATSSKPVRVFGFRNRAL